MLTKEKDKEKATLIGEIMVDITFLSEEEARRIADIVFGMKLAKELKGA